MNLEDELELEHILLEDRRCRKCLVTKNLIADFYKTRKDRGNYPSAFAYECKECTKKRIQARRKNVRKNRPRPLPPYLADYPDW